MYEKFEEFLKSGVRDYYKKSGIRQKANFIALAIASGEAASLLVDKVKSTSLKEKLIGGALGAIAIRMVLKWALGGPLGIVLSVATLGSTVAYAVSHQKEVFGQIETYRARIAETKVQYDEVQRGFHEGTYGQSERDLMIDGLLRRFVDGIDRAGDNANGKNK